MNRLSCKNVYEADSCNGLMNELKKGKCSHLILDIIFSDGTSLEIVPTIRKLYPDIKIMIFSMQLREIYAEAFRRYDIHHYLNKSAGEEETINYISKFVHDEAIPYDSKNTTNNNPFSSLTPRELEILYYLLNGYKTKDIATALNLGHSTVSTFKNRIFEKTGLSNMVQIIEMAAVYNLSANIDIPKKLE